MAKGASDDDGGGGGDSGGDKLDEAIESTNQEKVADCGEGGDDHMPPVIPCASRLRLQRWKQLKETWRILTCD